jgi:hypothetical protein
VVFTLNTLLYVYIGGGCLSLTFFLLAEIDMKIKFRGESSELERMIAKWAIEYSIFWPWRWVGFPLYIVVKNRLKREVPR